MKKLLIFSAIVWASCSTPNTHKEGAKNPVYVEYFKPYQIMMPDYVCSDTTMVIDAIGLNKAMALYEQGFMDFGDAELDSMMHQYCVSITLK